MRKIGFFALVVLILSSCKNEDKQAETLKLETQKQRLSYALGADHGHSISGSGDPNYPKYNLEKVAEGFALGIKEDDAFGEDCQQALRGLFGDGGHDFNEKYIDQGCECLGKLSGVVFRSGWLKKGGFEHFDDKYVVEGFRASIHKADTIVKRQDQMELIRNFYEDLNKQNGVRLLAEAAKRPNTASVDGLIIETLEEGKGRSPQVNGKVSAHYILMNAVGDTLQSSFEYEKYTGKSVEPFSLDQVIAGWRIGMQQMKEGGKYMLYVPYNLAYGEQGMFNPQRNAYDIQPYEALRFYIEMKQVIK